MSYLTRSLMVAMLACNAAIAVAAPKPAPRLEFTPPAGVEIKTITVIAPPDPAYFDVKRFDEMKYAMSGLIGRTLASIEKDDMKKVVAALTSSGEKFRAGLAERIAERLRTAGYTVTIDPGDWKSTDGNLSLALAQVQSPSDAVMLVTPTTMGFINPGGPFSTFIPSVLARVEMVGPDRTQTIYRGFHAAGWIPQVPGLVSVKKIKGWTGTPPTITYKEVGDILKDLPGAVKLLYSAEDAIAYGVEADLRK